MASIPVKSERDAFQIFETLNDRGLRLSVPDLLLNYLMGAASSDDERKQIREFWNEMLTQMGRRDINRFLRHLWISRFGDLKSQDLFSALKEHIEQKSLSSVQFASDCANECEAYVALLEPSEEQMNTVMQPLKALVRQLSSRASLPLLLSTYKSLSLQDFDKVVRWMVFVVRYSVVSKLDSSGAESVLFSLSVGARKKLSHAQLSQESKGEPTIVNNVNARETLTYLKEELRKASPTDEKVQSAAADLFLDNDEAKYVLSRIATYMQTETKEVKVDETNLEHIFPQHAKASDWGNKEKLQELEPYLWHIGNLTILGTRLNRTAGNKPYETKKKHYEQKSELEMAQEVTSNYASWDVSGVQHRAKNRLAPLFPKIWGFDNTSRV